MNSIQSAKWHEVIVLLKKKLPPISYDTWVKPLKLKDIDDEKNIIRLEFLNDFFIKIFKARYLMTLKETINSVFEKEYDVIFTLPEDQDTRRTNDKEQPESKLEQENYIDPNYTFDNFVVGNSNKFAHAAALSVAENPGKMYNPLFLYGESGLGKTHLMHAIGNYIQNHSNKRVLYVTSEQFIQDFIKTNRKDDEESNFNYVDFFKNKYRNIDVLLIDDIQFLGGATKTQSEFFHTFNNLYNDSKQIIISSDRSPNDLKVLEDRLRTRFNWGLEVNIFPPDFDLRSAIIRKKIAAEKLENDIPDDVIEYIASNTGTNVRQLEGAITRLVAYSSMMGSAKIDLDLAMEALKDTISTGITEKNDVARIQKIVSEYFSISVEDIRSKKRSSNIAFPRQIAMYLCRVMTSESFPRIGIEFGGKDHSTVMHSVEKIETEIKVNKDLANIIEKLKKDIGVV